MLLLGRDQLIMLLFILLSYAAVLNNMLMCKILKVTVLLEYVNLLAKEKYFY